MNKVIPAETFIDRKTNYIRDLTIDFGGYVRIHTSGIPFKKSMQAHAEGGIAIQVLGNIQGFVKFFSLCKNE